MMSVGILMDAIVLPTDAAMKAEAHRFRAYGAAAIVALILVGARVSYYLSLNLDWFRSQILAAFPLGAGEQARLTALLQPWPIAAADTAKTLAGFVVFVLFQAAVFSVLLGLVLPRGQRLRTLPVSAISQTPRILDAAAVLLGLFVMRRTNVTLGELDFLSFDALFGHLPVTSIWYEILASLTLPGLWGVWIVQRWLQARAGMAMLPALAVALIPQLLLYGFLVLVAVLI